MGQCLWIVLSSGLGLCEVPEKLYNGELILITNYLIGERQSEDMVEIWSLSPQSLLHLGQKLVWILSILIQQSQSRVYLQVFLREGILVVIASVNLKFTEGAEDDELIDILWALLWEYSKCAQILFKEQ